MKITEMNPRPVTKKNLSQEFNKFEEKLDQKINKLTSMINEGFIEAKQDREKIKKDMAKVQRQLDCFLVVEFDQAKG